MKKRIAVILAALVCAGGNVCFSRYDFSGMLLRTWRDDAS